MPETRNPASPAGGHEASDADVGTVFAFGVGLTVVTAAAMALVWLLFTYFAGRDENPARQFPLAVQQQNRLPPEPRLQANPRQDLTELRAQEDAVLSTYGWVDKSAGVVRIPITEAMRLTVERGLPTRGETKR